MRASKGMGYKIPSAEGMSKWLVTIGTMCILIMFATNLTDVVGAKFFKRPLLGSTEIVSYFQVAAIACALSEALLTGRHVKVDFFIDRITGSKFGQLVIRGVRTLELIFSALIVYEGFRFAESLRLGGEKGVSSNLPLYPFAYALASSFVPICLVLFRAVIKVEGSKLKEE